MGRKLGLGLVIAAAIVAVFLLLGGTDLVRSWTGGSAGDGDASHALDGTDAEKEGGAARGQERSAPVLFGRARKDRVGRGSVEGRVMDFASGAAVENAGTLLTGTGHAGESLAHETRTDASGYFRFEDVAAGEGYVVAISAGAQEVRSVASCSVDHGAVTDLGTLWLGKRGVLRGRVLDEGGRPVADADVQVHPGGASMLEMLTNMGRMMEQLDKDAEPRARTTSDAKGSFEIADLAPGPFTLIVRSAGFQQSRGDYVMAQQAAAGGDLEVRLLAAPSVRGIVVDQDGRPLGGARIACLQKNDIASVLYGRQFSETGSDGRFVIGAPPTPGQFAVIVTAAGYPTLFTKTQGTGEQRFVLRGGTEVRLRIVDATTRRGIEGARIMATCSGDPERPSEGGMSFAAAVTDSAGEATFSARPGALEMLWFSHDERGEAMFMPRLRQLAGVGGGAAAMLQGPKDVTIGKTRRTLEFTVSTGITISGRVTDEDGKGLGGVRCMTFGTMSVGNSVVSDEDGHYILANQSPPVRMLLVKKAGYVQVRGDGAAMLLVTKTEDTTVNVTMRRAGSVTGRVVTSAGAPVVGARIKASSQGGMAMLSAVSGGARESITSADGRYRLDGVEPGKQLRVMARLAGHLDAQTEELALTSGGLTRAPDLVMRVGTTLKVLVKEPGGREASGAQVELEVDMAADVPWELVRMTAGRAPVTAKDDGTVELRHVPAGETTITASKEGFAPGRVRLEIEPPKPGAAAAREVLVTLRRAVLLKGRVVDNDDQPIAGASIGIETPHPNDAEAWLTAAFETSGDDGRFTGKGLPGGPLRLSVSAAGYRPAAPEVVAGRGEVVVRLAKLDTATTERLEAIRAEMLQLSVKMAAAKDDAERAALSQRVFALRNEQAALEEAGK